MNDIFEDLKFEEESFFVGKDNFDDLIIKETPKNDLFYFTLKNKGLIKRFVLKNQGKVIHIVKISLIKKNDKFTPRFTFQIFNNTKKVKDQYLDINTRNKDEVLKILIKANVSFEECHEEFLQLISVISKFKEIEVLDSKYKIVDSNSLNIDSSSDVNKVINFIKTLNENVKLEKSFDLSLLEGIKAVEDAIKQKEKRDALSLFNDNMLNKIEEPEWQKFFEEHVWIFGNSIDFRFLKILQREFSASDTDAAGKEQVKGDFLLGDQNFVHFVEIKKPDTPLFKKDSNRSGCWLLSTQLQDSVSQIIEQRESGNIKINRSVNLFNSSGTKINQKSYNPKAILVIGSFESLSGDSDKEREIKLKTFESYRNELKNITILTYDEILQRATNLVSDKEIKIES